MRRSRSVGPGPRAAKRTSRTSDSARRSRCPPAHLARALTASRAACSALASALVNAAFASPAPAALAA